MKKYRLKIQKGYPDTLEVGKAYPADFKVQGAVVTVSVASLVKYYPDDWQQVSPYEERVEEIEKRLDALDKKFDEILNRLKV